MHFRRLRISIAGTLCCGIAGVASAQSATPVGDDFRVDTLGAGGNFAFEEQPDVAVPASGFVIVWQSNANDDGDISAQRYDDDGDEAGSAFTVNTTTGDKQKDPRAAGASGFVVVWESEGDNDDDVRGRRYDSAGAAQGNDFRVNSTTANDQEEPSVAMASSGDFVVVWESSDGQDGSQEGIFGQRFSSAGATQGGEFQVNTTTTGNQNSPAVGRRSTGEFFVAWESDDASNTGVFAQRFTAAGVKAGDELPVNTTTSDDQEEPDVAAADNGYVVVWESEVGNNDEDVYARRYDVNGNARGGEFRVNSVTGGAQVNPAVAAFADGEFVVVWEDSDRQAIYGQEYDADGDKIGGEFKVNTSEGDMEIPRIAVEPGGFIVTWKEFVSGFSGSRVWARRYEVPEPGPASLGLAALAALAVLSRRRKE